MGGYDLTGWLVVQCSTRRYYGVYLSVLLLLSNRSLILL